MISEEYETYLPIAIEIAQKAGEMITKAVNEEERQSITEKSNLVDFVTETDKKIERFIFSKLKESFPSHCFIGEESVENKCFSTAPTWIVDPIDGTTNFIHHFPAFAISIGFAVEGEPVLGVVNMPQRNEIYTAVKGKGAFKNGKPIHVSKATNISESLIATNIGYGRTKELVTFVAENMNRVLFKNSHGIRMSGSAVFDMISVASGVTDAYYEFGINIWDICAGVIIVREAGGVVTDPSGRPLNLLLNTRRVLAACSSSLVDDIAKTIDGNHPENPFFEEKEKEK